MVSPCLCLSRTASVRILREVIAFSFFFFFFFLPRFSKRFVSQSVPKKGREERRRKNHIGNCKAFCHRHAIRVLI